MASIPILSISWYNEVGSVGSDLVREAGRGGGHLTDTDTEKYRVD